MTTPTKKKYRNLRGHIAVTIDGVDIISTVKDEVIEMPDTEATRLMVKRGIIEEVQTSKNKE